MTATGTKQAISTKNSNAKCPRCGYDLRGTIETWTEQCPLNGICTECGLEFQWEELLSSKAIKPKWNVEYAQNTLGVFGRSIITLVFTAFPGIFWKMLKMTHRPQWKRIAIYLSLCVAAIYSVFAIGHGSIALSKWWQYNSSVSVSQYVVGENSYWSQSTGNYITDSSAYWVTAQAILLPWSDSSPGKLKLINNSTSFGRKPNEIRLYVKRLPNGTMPPLPKTVDHPGPIDLFKEYSLTNNRNQSFSFWTYMRRAHIYSSMFYINAFPIFVGTLCIAFFALLPQTRRKAKVRWEHLLRVGAYSVPLLLIPTVWAIVGKVARYYTSWDLFDFILLWAYIAFLFIPAALVIWWWMAAKRYLHMPHAFGVAASAVSCAFLLTLMCGYFLFVARLQVALQ